MSVEALAALGKTIIVLVLFAALVYLALQEGWASAGNNSSLQWLALILYSAFLGIGLSGAILWRRATGQIVTDEADIVEHEKYAHNRSANMETVPSDDFSKVRNHRRANR